MHIMSCDAAISFLTCSSAVSVKWPRRMQIEKDRAKLFHQRVCLFILQPIFQPVSTQMASSTQGGICVKYLYPATVFFKSGLTIACLNSVGTFDVVRDTFIVAVISGTNSYEHRFSNHASIGTHSTI